MKGSATPDIVIANGLLLALLPQLGDRPEPTQALLKWAGPGPLLIERSRFETGGAAREDSIVDAMTLPRGMVITPPASLSLIDLRTSQQALLWRLNQLSVRTVPIAAKSAAVVQWLPLILPLNDDPHFIVTLVNRGLTALNLPELVYESCLTINGHSFAFANPGHWDGRANIAPTRSAVLRLRFDHYGAGIPDGSAKMGFTIGKWSTPQSAITWQCRHD